jgi:hypothetical protein
MDCLIVIHCTLRLDPRTFLIRKLCSRSTHGSSVFQGRLIVQFSTLTTSSFSYRMLNEDDIPSEYELEYDQIRVDEAANECLITGYDNSADGQDRMFDFLHEKYRFHSIVWSPDPPFPGGGFPALSGIGYMRMWNKYGEIISEDECIDTKFFQALYEHDIYKEMEEEEQEEIDQLTPNDLCNGCECVLSFYHGMYSNHDWVSWQTYMEGWLTWQEEMEYWDLVNDIPTEKELEEDNVRMLHWDYEDWCIENYPESK